MTPSLPSVSLTSLLDRWEDQAAKRNLVISSFGFLCGLIVLSPEFVSGNDFGGFFLGVLLLFVACALLLIVVVSLLRRYPAAVLAMLGSFGLTLTLGYFVAYDIHNHIRWMMRSEAYKARVLASPAVTGQFNHVQWDGWGGPGAGDTTVYLIHDTEDRLAEQARTGVPGKAQGIPCPFYKLERMQKEWYLVYFFTDTYWPDLGASCTDGPSAGNSSD